MLEANRRLSIHSLVRGDGTLSVSAPRRSAVAFAANQGTGERKFIWPLAATLMLIALVWALARELDMPPEQRAAIFAVQSQAYP